MASGQENGDLAKGPSDTWAYGTSAYGAETTDATAVSVSWLEEQSQLPFIQEVGTRSLARLALQPGERILELGCGTGVFLPRLMERVGPTGWVVGLDHSPALLAGARERIAAAGLGNQVELLEGDAHHQPFADSAFDAAHCERVLMHVEDPDQVVHELRRVVRPGGRVVAAEVHAAGGGFDGADPDLSATIGRRLVSGIRNPWMGLSLRGRFVDAGFSDVSGEVVGYFEEELDQGEADEAYQIARNLADREEISRERAEAWIDDLEARRARGAYCGLALIFVVSGRVPDA
jgi:ubiquinone/menaquinone biosynthesis C-methylase UbiE